MLIFSAVSWTLTQVYPLILSSQKDNEESKCSPRCTAEGKLGQGPREPDSLQSQLVSKCSGAEPVSCEMSVSLPLTTELEMSGSVSSVISLKKADLEIKAPVWASLAWVWCMLLGSNRPWGPSDKLTSAWHYMGVAVQLLSCVWLFTTPGTEARQASLSITNSRSLLKLMSIELVMPSNYLILYHPLLLLPSIFPSIRVFSYELVLPIKWPKYWSFSISHGWYRFSKYVFNWIQWCIFHLLGPTQGLKFQWDVKFTLISSADQLENNDYISLSRNSENFKWWKINALLQVSCWRLTLKYSVIWT